MATMRSRRCLEPSVVALRLKDLCCTQCMAQPLVLDDRADVDLAEPVVALIAEALAVGSDVDLAVVVLVDVDVAVDERDRLAKFVGL